LGKSRCPASRFDVIVEPMCLFADAWVFVFLFVHIGNVCRKCKVGGIQTQRNDVSFVRKVDMIRQKEMISSVNFISAFGTFESGEILSDFH